MSDLISRADLFNALATVKAPPEANEYKAEVYTVIQELPSAEAVHKPDYSYEADMVRRLKEALSAEAVQGEWIFNPKDAIESMFMKPKCSKCGFESSDGGNFCPNCGARIKGAEHEID